MNGIDMISPLTGAGHRVTIFSQGMVQGVVTAVSLRGTTSDISNWGVIDGGATGIFLNATGSGLQRVVNFGIVTAGATGIAVSGTTAVSIENAGTISAYATAIKAAGNAAVTVVNSGSIYGDIRFGGGRDVYDGSRGGIVTGSVLGGSGDDRFRPGAAAETFNGGTGFDIVAFNGNSPVWASLDGSDLQLGAATDDTYISIEGLNGGGGDDILSGSNAANALNGRSGADQLIGLGGDDTLTGGRGADTLSGGSGRDTFVFNDLRDAGDIITDFTGGGVDVIQISAEGFGLTLPAGALNADLFGSIMEPNAKALFYYTGGPLYFDRDGAGTAYVPVKLATFNQTLTAEDFVIV